MSETQQHATCPFCSVHEASIRDLAALLRAAVEVDEIADIVREHADLTVDERRRFEALRHAVTAMEGKR